MNKILFVFSIVLGIVAALSNDICTSSVLLLLMFALMIIIWE